MKVLNSKKHKFYHSHYYILLTFKRTDKSPATPERARSPFAVLAAKALEAERVTPEKKQLNLKKFILSESDFRFSDIQSRKIFFKISTIFSTGD